MTYKNLSSSHLFLVARREKEGGGDSIMVAECRHDFEFGLVVSYEALDTNIKEKNPQ